MKLFFLTLILLLLTTSLFCQNVGINNTGMEPDSTAMLDVQSTTKGFLTPRMTSVERNAIESPAEGLIVFDLDLGNFLYFSGGEWKTIYNSPIPELCPTSEDSFYIQDLRYIDLQDGIIYTATKNPGKIYVFTKNTSNSLIILGTYDLSGFNITGLAIDGNKLYVPGFGNFSGTRILNVSDPTNIFQSDQIPIGNPPPTDIRQDQNNIVNRGASPSTLIAYDKATKNVISTYFINNPVDYAVQDTLLYVLYNNGNLEVVDLTVAPIASLISTTDTGDDSERIILNNSKAYITSPGNDNLKIIDLSNPTQPVVQSTVHIGDFPSEMSINGDRCFVLDEISDSISIVDISNPASPLIIKQFGVTQNLSLKIKANGSSVYYLHNGKLEVFNLAKTQIPVQDQNGRFSSLSLFEPWKESELGIKYLGGNVGIGVQSAKTPLEIKGNGGTSSVGITQNQVGGEATMEFTTEDGLGMQASRMVIRGGGENADIEFYSGIRGEEEKLIHIESTNGYLGLGDIDPLYKLDVRGDQIVKSSHPKIHLATTSVDNEGISLNYDASNSALKFESRTNDGSTWQENLMIVSSTGVTIGNDLPLYKLDVRGDQILKDSRPVLHLATTNTAGDGISLEYHEVEEAFKIQKRTNNGSTYQDNLLTVDINGGLWVPDLPMGDHNNMQYNATNGQFYHDTSSKRFKNNITTLATNFMQILKASPKTYTRENNPDRWEIGYIAEEMDELGLTELVSYDEEGIPSNFNYRKMTLYLNEVNKVQQQKIEKLESELAEIKSILVKIIE